MNCFIDRELSWLQFNYRVLIEADDNSVPLLERLNFLSIYYSNLDEFFMVRVGSLTHRKVLLPDYTDSKTGWNTATQLKHILKEVENQQQKAEEVYTHLLFDLKAAGIEVVDFSKITKLDESAAKKIFSEVKEMLSVRIVDAQHPIQFLGNCERYLATYLGKGESNMLGIISLYRLPRFRVYETNGVKKIFPMPELVHYFSSSVYKKYTVREGCVIRVTRNADVFVQGEIGGYSEDFRQNMEQLLRKRKRQQPVRLQIEGKISKPFKKLLIDNVGIDEKNVYSSFVPLDLGFGKELGPMPALKYKPRKAVKAFDLHRGEYFRAIEKEDLLLSFPHQSMSPFIDLLYEAADDPNVTSIKITLYRLSSSSKVAMALAYAADQGKDVLCLLELRARFDEKNNIDYSDMLTEAGCHVIYGLPDYKVHSKLCLITRSGTAGETYITQVGTGNYNEVTSEIYCDLSLMTADQAVGADAKAVFETLAMGELPPRTEHLMMAPLGFKEQLLEMMEAERLKGEEGSLSFKINSMNDMEVMQKLIDCSKAGVKIELFIRGICCLKPGIEGETENIRVKSIIGRYLEHSRIYVFGKGTEQRIFIGSGDLLSRNTERRVEAFIEVKTERTRKDVLEVMDAIRDDDERAWVMNQNGTFQRTGTPDESACQDRLYRYFTNEDHNADLIQEHANNRSGKRGFFARLFKR